MRLPVFILIYIKAGFLLNAQTLGWGHSVGGPGDDEAYTSQIADNGDLIVGGWFSGTVDFDPGPAVVSKSSLGGYDMFITRFDSVGNFLWVKTFGGVGWDLIYHLNIDPLGNLVITGYFNNTVDFDPGPGTHFKTSAGLQDAFVLKLDSIGNFIWVNTYGSTSGDFGLNVLTNSMGEIIAFGDFQHGVDFNPSGSGGYISAGSTSDAFVVKLNSAGNFMWVKSMGGTGRCLSESADLDPSGNIFLTGKFDGDVDFNPTGTSCILSAPLYDVFICKLSSSGSFNWAKSISGPNGLDEVHALKADPFGNIIISGGFYDTADFNPNTGVHNLVSNGDEDIYVAKYDNAGNLVWVNQIGGDLMEYSSGMTCDNLGNIYCGGEFSGTVDFDPGPAFLTATSLGAYDAFLFKLDLNGNLVWCHTYGSVYSDGIDNIKTNNYGDLFFCGYFRDSIDIDPSTGTHNIFASGIADGFIAKYKQNACDYMSISIDTLNDAACYLPGYSAVSASFGVTPYNYSWNTIPVVTDSIVNFPGGGYYTATVTDAIGCMKQKTILVGGPAFITGYDLDANLVATNFRPGFPSNIWVDGFNNGCDTVSGYLTLILDSLVSYNYATPSPDIVSGDTLVWYFISLNNDSAHLAPFINVSTPSSATVGDTLTFKVLLNPTGGDMDPGNNYKVYKKIIVSSYDPNGKSVYPLGQCQPNYVLNSGELTYTIQFQNTGTIAASNIVIIDTIDYNLNVNTVKIVGSSHYLITELISPNILKFRFDHINLPDATSSEPGSHGYLIYSILPVTGLSNDIQVENNAAIYFDYNAPVFTNTVINTIVDSIPLFYSNIQNVNLTCGDDYVFPDGSIQTDITSTLTHVSYFSPSFYCDSITTTNIIIDPLNLAVNQSIFTLTAVSTATTYQWIDCSTNLPVPGETNQVFTAIADGDYAVIISNGSCSDTSACYNITGTGLQNTKTLNHVRIYPNPTNNMVIIEEESVIEKIEIRDVYMNLILTINPSTNKSNIDLSSYAKGVYFVSVLKKDSGKICKLILE